MSILEAMSHGLPVIAPETGGLPEIIENGRHGYLVRGRDPRAYADLCLRLIENRVLLRGVRGCRAEKRSGRNFPSMP
jgi:glycosyltransferase involved in cell wall biosynthesis